MTIQYFHIIGAGKVGQSLAMILNKHPDWQLGSVYSRSEQSANALLASCPEGLKCHTIKDLPVADVIFITTTDTQIGNIAQELSHLAWVHEKKPLILHCSGSVSHHILHKLQQNGALTSAMHPVFAFANPKVACENLAGHFAAIDADSPSSYQKTVEIAKTLQLKPFEIQPQHKVLYHAALSASANFLVSLADLTQSWLQTAGMTVEDSQHLIHSLMQQNINNLANLSPHQALTGPISRADTQTICYHFQALPDAISQECYRALALATLKTAQLPVEQEHAMQEMIHGFTTASQHIHHLP